MPKTRSRDARAPPLAPGPCAETSVRWFEATVAHTASSGWAASCRLVPPPPHAEQSPRAPSHFPLRGLQQPANQDARRLAATQLSAVNQQCAGRGSPNCQTTCQSAGPAPHPSFVGSFIRLASVPCCQPLLRQAPCQVLRVPTRIPHTCLPSLNPSSDTYWEPTMNQLILLDLCPLRAYILEEET